MKHKGIMKVLTPESQPFNSADYRNRLKGCRVAAAVALVTLLVFNVPWLPRQFEYDLDSSWRFVLHELFIGHYAFGSDILWHYGPLGFLSSKHYHPDTYIFLLAGWAILSCIVWLGLYRVATRISASPDPLTFLIIAILTVMTDEALFLLLPSLLFLWCHFSKPNSPAVSMLLILGMAAGAMVKISYLLFGLGIVVIIDGYRLLYNRSIPWMLPFYLILTLLLWLACGQSPEHFLPFLHAGIEHAAGFGIMAQDRSNPILPPFFLFLCAFMFIAASAAWKNDYRWRATAPLLCLMFLFYTLFKIGFMNNNDHHRLQAIGTLLCVLLLLRDTFWPQVPRWAKSAFFLICLTVIVTYGLRFFLVTAPIENKRQAVTYHSKESPYAAVRSLPDLFAVHALKFQETMAEIRKREPLPRMDEDSDILGAHQIALFASGSRYAPRPVFQSYHAYTPYLARENLAFMQDKRSPQHLFFNIDVIQGRFPSQDDGLLWPELLARYDIVHLYGHYLHLKKRKENRPVSLQPILSLDTRLNHAVRVPPLSEDGAVWAKIHAEPTWLGRFARLLFRTINFYIRYTTNSGYSDTRRLVIATAGEGFMLSPVINNSLQFTLMMGGEFPLLSPLGLKEFTIMPEPGMAWLAPLLYKEVLSLEFFRLRFLRQDLAEIPEWDRHTETLARLTSYPFHSAIAGPDNVVDQHIAFSRANGQNTIQVNGEARLYYPLNGYEKTIQATFGADDVRSRTRYPGDGIYFSIESVAKESEAKQVLWKAFMPPPQYGGTVRQTLRVVLPKDIRGVFFNTTPVSPEKSSRAFWSDVRIE